MARSSTGAEYSALAIAAAEVLWLQQLLRDPHVYLKSPTTAHCDNIGALYLAHNPLMHSRTKHISIDYHFVREKVMLGDPTPLFLGLAVRERMAFFFPWAFINVSCSYTCPNPDSSPDVTTSRSHILKKIEKKRTKSR